MVVWTDSFDIVQTSKRTTRRPQTLAQTTYAMHHPPPPPSSPFTHTPLARTPHTPLPPPPQHQPYPGYPYPYPSYGAYPGYPPYTPHPAARTSTPSASVPPYPKTADRTVPTASTSTSLNKGKALEGAATSAGSSDVAGDAWEAAQHILKAINFRSLETASASAASTSTAMDVDATGDDGLGRATLTDEERASLQAQLALLAAQLSEIAEMEVEAEDAAAAASVVSAISATTSLPGVAPQQVVTQAPMQAQTAAQGQGQGQPERIIIDVNQFPDDFVLVTGPPAAGVSEPPAVAPLDFNLEAAVNNMVELAAQTAQAEVLGEANADPPSEDGAAGAEDDEDDDEDMEMVDVDSYMRQEGLQT